MKQTAETSLSALPSRPASDEETILITGGTGFLGSLLTAHLLKLGHKVRVYARSEHGHERLASKTPVDARKRLSTCLGSVEDVSRLSRALSGVSMAIHAAAQKIVPLAEYDPGACVATNVSGTANVIEACLRAGVKRAVLVSTDKASAPYTVYGASKLCAERLWIAANSYSAGRSTEFFAVRYGNVWGSRGSVLEAWTKQIQKSGEIEVTHPSCTRWHITASQACEFVLTALKQASPGDLWIPKLPRYALGTLAQAFGGKVKEIGLRLAEKKHEDLISEHESCSVRDQDAHKFILRPGEVHEDGGWAYRSSASDARSLTIEELQEAIGEWRSER